MTHGDDEVSEENGSRPEYKDRTLILIGIGILLLIPGVISAFLGPLEMYCFYLFSEGGPFHYVGFGFGSLMFANIACQILGYYLIAAVFLPIGYGHVKTRRWVRPLSLGILRAWLIVGLPVTVVALFSVLSVKNYSPVTSFAFMAVLGLFYFVVPWCAIRFYRSRSVRMTLEARDSEPSRVERLTVGVLTLALLLMFYAVVMHVPILLSGLFPIFGVLLTGLRGIVALAISIVTLAVLAWGVFRQQKWAWWGSLAFFLLLTLFSTTTFLSMDYQEVLAKMHLPAKEAEIMGKLPLKGFHLAIFVGVPLVLTLGAIIRSKRHFGGRDESSRS